MTSAQGWSLRTVIQFHQTLFILSLFYFHFAFLFISEILKKKKKPYSLIHHITMLLATNL